MFGLSQQVGGADFGVNGVIGNHQGFGWTGEEINANPAKQLAFGLCHKGVTGAD